MEPVVGGIQGFPGFSPDAEVNDGRAAWGTYVEAEQMLTSFWLLGAAARFESVEFTGESIVGRLQTRVDATDFLSFRGSASSGSRSPDIQKIYFSQRITAILPVGLTETVTAGDAHPLRGEFGIGQLKPERSRSLSGGFAIAPELSGGTRLSFTADAYQVQIRDRILLSESVTGQVPPGEMDSAGRQQFRELLEDNQLGAAQFFVNAADTTTRGVDLIGSWGTSAAENLDLDFAGAFYYTQTRIEGSNPNSSLVESTDLLGPVLRNRLERGQPRYTATIGHTTSYDPVAFNVSMNYYGPVTGKAFMRIEDKKVWGGKWLTNASVSYTPLPGLLVTLGGLNIFNVLPDKWGAVGREYPEIGYVYGFETQPFGVNGGFYYLKAGYTL
jgi:iron complex outermembrane receptor protein